MLKYSSKRGDRSEWITGDDRPKWFNSPVSFHKGTLEDIRSFIPEFERRAFALTQPGNECSRMNARLDTIVSRPFGDDQNFISVGVVSKEYSLVPHLAVLDVAEKALDKAKIAPEEVRAELKLTEYGERMALSLYLPKKFSFDPGDSHSMEMRLEFKTCKKYSETEDLKVRDAIVEVLAKADEIKSQQLN